MIKCDPYVHAVFKMPVAGCTLILLLYTNNIQYTVHLLIFANLGISRKLLLL